MWIQAAEAHVGDVLREVLSRPIWRWLEGGVCTNSWDMSGLIGMLVARESEEEVGTIVYEWAPQNIH